MSNGGAKQTTTGRFDVRSSDGTSLAVWIVGDGPPLVLVHGGLQDHTASGVFVDELRADMTTFSMDRRGRGASSDATGPYSIEREFEDVAAVVDAAAERTGGPVALWGHSYGANCVIGGTALTKNVGHLVVYEPGLGFTYPAGSIEATEQHLAAGDMEAAALELLVGVMDMTEEEVDALRSSPTWPARLATVPTLPRELRAEDGWVYRPGQFDDIRVPTLLLAGSESPPAQADATRRAANVIPGARIQVLEGHGHFAHRTAPAMVAAIIRQFIVS